MISGWETGGNIEEELDDLIFSHNQLTAIRFQNCFSDCRCHALIAVSERVRLRQVVRERRGTRHNIGSFVPMPVLGCEEGRFQQACISQAAVPPVSEINLAWTVSASSLSGNFIGRAWANDPALPLIAHTLFGVDSEWTRMC